MHYFEIISGFEFFAKGDSKDCISPKNLLEYWKQVLMQVSAVFMENIKEENRLEYAWLLG